jgi:predicted RNase H-like HicB family nuclease
MMDFAMERLEMKKIHLPIIIEIDEDGYYIVTCPLFKGCHSYGETIDEALENIKEVIDLCLEEARNFLRYNREIYNVI